MSTPFPSQMTGAQIENALNKVNGLIAAANNGKILCIDNGSIAAKSAIEIQGGTIDPITITENGTYTHQSGGAYSPVVVNVPRTAVVQAGSFTQNGVFTPPSGVDGYNSVTINVPTGSIGDCFGLILVYYSSGNSCTCSQGSIIYTATGSSGIFGFAIPSSGNWTITVSNGTISKTETVTISTRGETKQVYLYFAPSAYTELEYIQSSGTQYINAQLTVAVNFKANICLSIPNNVDSDIFGITENNSSSYRAEIMFRDNKLGLFASTGAGSESFFSDDMPLDQFQNIEYTQGVESQKLTWNNASIDKTATTVIRNYCYLFAYVGTRWYYSSIKMSKAVLFNDGVIVRYMIPCKRISDEAIGMWDAINNRFYGNDGTGTFIAGPELT